MRCPQCGYDNKERAKFCNECGSRLEVLCAACATTNPPGSKFCSGCGSPLATSPPVPNPPPPAPHPLGYTPPHLGGRLPAEHASPAAPGTPDRRRQDLTPPLS